MKLTPGQVAELKDAKNVRGSIIDGTMSKPVFLVTISFSAFERVQVLTHAQSMPPSMMWYVASSNPNRVELHTTHPEWFVELEEMIDVARRASR